MVGSYGRSGAIQVMAAAFGELLAKPVRARCGGGALGPEGDAGDEAHAVFSAEVHQLRFNVDPPMQRIVGLERFETAMIPPRVEPEELT